MHVTVFTCTVSQVLVSYITMIAEVLLVYYFETELINNLCTKSHCMFYLLCAMHFDYRTIVYAHTVLYDLSICPCSTGYFQPTAPALMC